MERNMIAWNVPNWITITIMAMASYAILGAAAQLLKRGQTTSTTSSGGY